MFASSKTHHSMLRLILDSSVLEIGFKFFFSIFIQSVFIKNVVCFFLNHDMFFRKFLFDSDRPRLWVEGQRRESYEWDFLEVNSVLLCQWGFYMQTEGNEVYQWRKCPAPGTGEVPEKAKQNRSSLVHFHSKNRARAGDPEGTVGAATSSVCFLQNIRSMN